MGSSLPAQTHYLSTHRRIDGESVHKTANETRLRVNGAGETWIGSDDDDGDGQNNNNVLVLQNRNVS